MTKQISPSINSGNEVFLTGTLPEGSNVLGSVHVTDTPQVQSTTEPMAIRLDEVDSNTLYVGEADVGTVDSASLWKIKKVTTTGTIIKIEWADSVQTFTKIWNNRTTYTYG
ncbi:MAG: hypothetical protein Q8O88_01455 [bacterium]|nr:hypothetical protein [bacterium]